MQKYKKVRIVGKGSFGYAVLVESKKSKKQYIMKIIDISKMDQKQIEEALMEVHLLKVMRYPYIVTYRESFMEKMCLCIVMDYCEGGDMFHKIAKQKELGTLFPEQQIVTWLVQMALAMNYVHDKKILHRDLKTQNIFLTSKGDIKIGDFGIARVLQHTYDCANTAIGTPYYLSPEICQEKPYNQKSDIWSLGCIFYEIATLNHAFDAQNMKGLVQKILKGTYPPLPEVYSADLKKLLSEMLIKDPNKRPSIKKILEMPFMKVKINQLFSSTIKIHELKLEKENTCNRSELFGDKDRLSKLDDKKSKDRPPSALFKRRDQHKETSKDISKDISKENSKEKKLEVISKNSSGLGFRKKIDSEVYRDGKLIAGDVKLSVGEPKPSTGEIRLIPKRLPLKDQVNTARSFKKQCSQEKHFKKDSLPGTFSEQPSKKSQEKSIYEEEETLEEQGYGLLLRDMKRCIKGGQAEEDSSWKLVEEKVAPKYLKMEKVPGVGDRDTVGSKIEALRAYLEKEVGDKFYDAYRMIQQQKDDDYAGVKAMMGGDRVKFIPLIVQLIVCEDNYY